MDIRLFVTDIDGVWTDGSMYYDQTGNEWKRFNTADSAGVLFLRLLNIPTAIVTGEDTQIVARRAQKLGIPHLFMGVKNKLLVVQQLCHELNIELEQVAYIGDDINDVHLLRKVGLSAAPINAPDYIKREVQWELPIKGGDGAFRYFVERFLKETNRLDFIIEQAINHLTPQ